MAQRYTSSLRSIPLSWEGPTEEKGGPEFECMWFSPGPPVSAINKTDRHDI